MTRNGAHNRTTAAGCPGRDQLVAFHAGMLDFSAIDELGEHLAECPYCESVLDTLYHRPDTIVAQLRDAARCESQELQRLLAEPEFHEFEEFAKRIGRTVAGDGGRADGGSSMLRSTVMHAATEGAVSPRIGRFYVLRLLGRGGFAEVYLARDPQQGGNVAVKIPRWDRIDRDHLVEGLLREAETVSVLEHPGIIAVRDWGRTEDGRCFLAMEYVDGRSLQEVMASASFDAREIVDLVAAIAEALHYAHKQGFVHRDVKPANILLDEQGIPRVADFGLAVHDHLQWFHRGELAGTRPYMAPEQVRGESHRLDGRTDVWSLGVILYELLTGQRPFESHHVGQLEDEIQYRDPKPLRQVNDKISTCLERVCLKCLSKKMTDRFATARDLATKLRQVSLEADSRPTPALPPSVIPRGLHAFGTDDAAFFHRLLPGPRSVEGTPEVIRAWTARLERTDASVLAPVCVLYGPSGAGKTSFVQAGLIPRLSAGVLVVSVEATTGGLEQRLLYLLRRHDSDLSEDASLADALARIRTRSALPPGRNKILIVIDQFEQWLHANRGDIESPLVQALRHCDGERIQALLLVRDDFWMATIRFMRELELPLLDGSNSGALELFDERHACGVLELFGRAYGALPDEPDALDREQQLFVSRAVRRLAEEGWLFPIRLALFADMVRNKSWTPQTLDQLGGVEGVGVAYLEETFGASKAPPMHRFYEGAIRRVLKVLLPATGVDIKGAGTARNALVSAAGPELTPERFSELLRILVHETRLITPVDDVGAAFEGGLPRMPPREECYQLTHDFLVPSLREWLGRKQRETRRGRAEILLAERTALWKSRPESKQLPTLGEWARIRLLTKARHWSESSRALMDAADRYYLRRGGLSAVLLVLAMVGGWSIRRHVHGTSAQSQAEAIVKRLLVGEIDQVPTIVSELGPYLPLVRDQLREIRSRSTEAMEVRMRASLALVGDDPGEVPFLLSEVLSPSTRPDALLVIREFLQPGFDQYSDDLWETAHHHHDLDVRFRAACVLAECDPESSDWPALYQPVVSSLIAQPGVFLQDWLTVLERIAPSLISPLEADFHNITDDAMASNAATALWEFDGRQTRRLVSLLEDSHRTGFHAILPLLERSDRSVIVDLDSRLQRLHPEGESSDDSRRAAREANVAIALWQLGQPSALLNRLAYIDEPNTRIPLIHTLNAHQIAPAKLLELYSDNRTQLPARRALLATLGERAKEDLPPSIRQLLLKELKQAYKTDPDPGIHSSCETVLRRMHETVWLDETQRELQRRGRAGQERWLINPVGQTMSVVQGAERRFAIATTEVSLAQFLESDPEHDQLIIGESTRQIPATCLHVRRAIRYCQWLSEQEFPPSEWCYPPLVELKGENFRAHPDFLSRQGYRLPTSGEWEQACRAGTATPRFCGDDDALVRHYGWEHGTAGGDLKPVGVLLPNDFGLFDVYGNATEICHNIPELSIGFNGQSPASTPPPEFVLRGPTSRMRTPNFNSTVQRGLFISVGDSDSTAGFRIARTLRDVDE